MQIPIQKELHLKQVSKRKMLITSLYQKYQFPPSYSSRKVSCKKPARPSPWERCYRQLQKSSEQFGGAREKRNSGAKLGPLQVNQNHHSSSNGKHEQNQLYLKKMPTMDFAKRIEKYSNPRHFSEHFIQIHLFLFPVSFVLAR